jgi:outer membrane receptor protein involved in Fe transport
MPSLRARWSVVCLAVAICFLSPNRLSAQGTNGRILGHVVDPSGAVLPGVKVTLVNEATSVSRDGKTSDNGDYDFVEIPVGTYRLEFDLTGFKKNIRRGVGLDINQVITLNMTMQLGATQEVVDVTSEAPLVETTSTQLGAVVGDRAVSQLPLNSRDTYQLLQLQPGVMSTVGSSNSIVYGSSNAGAVSVNGGRGRSNNFNVNGGDANDQFANLPTVQPSPDSIQEFRVLTNTFDAEYGRNSGSIVNVVTKSGTNEFHGNMYEFFRNTVLNANAYCFSADGCPKPQFNQNQFGGTFGGPIKKDRTFFFGSYEGRRIRQGVQSPAVTVPTAAERPSASQPFADFSSETPFSGILTSAYALNQRPGCAQAISTQTADGASLADNAHYTTYTDQGGTTHPGIFTDVVTGQENIIPLACMDATAVDLLQFVPTPTNGSTLVTVPVQPERGDQFTVKIDHRINDKQNISLYYYFDDHSLVSPFAQFQAAGANIPGFASATKERFQQWNISHNWTINNTTVNEFRFNYNREAQRTFQHPQRTSLVQDSCPAAPSWLTDALGSVPCFSDGTADNATGIHPGLGANREGLPFIQLSGGFTIGNNAEGELPQVGNSFQWSDSISKVKGNHSFKFGADVRRQRFDQTLYFNVSGEFFFDGSSSNSTLGDTVFSDYLLGFPGSYGQGSAQVENVRSTGLYLFAQDSWKLKPNLTLNYGLRWELNTPMTDIGHHVQTFRPGQNSKIYPCQLSQASIDLLGTSDCTSVEPTGLLVPGDPGVPNGLTQTYYKAWAPRIGLAWSPGNSGKTSVRAGWGLFYNPIEQLVLEQFSAEPPFGGSSFPADTLFNAPFKDQSGTFSYPNPFGGILNPARGQPVDWSTFRPILLFGQFQPKLRSQYSAQYNLTVQHQLTHDMELQLSYVGSQGHRLLATHDLNYGNPQTCLGLQAISDYYNSLDPTDPRVSAYACGPYSADSAFSVAAGDIPAGMSLTMPYGSQATVTGPNPTPITLVGLRKYSSPNCDPLTGNGCPPDGVPVFSSVFAQDTIANSAYNSFQASLEKRFAHGMQFTTAYTWSKSFDEASSFEGILNPIDPRISRSLSSFDARHRLVFSYYWDLPIHKYDGVAGKILSNWSLSGVTTFQTGFPIRITSQADNELMYSFDFELPGEPAQLAPFHKTKPQSTCFNGQCNYGFDPNSFTENATDNTVAPCSDGVTFGCYDQALLGTLGNAKRTICCGPHLSNTDFAILKTIPLSEARHIDFRAEFFNIFNHTQFFNPDGNTSDGSQFGQVTQARDPRLMQFALKFFF